MPDVRRPGHANWRESGGAGSRSEADAGRRRDQALAGRCCAQTRRRGKSPRCSPRCWRRCRRTPACRPMCRSSSSRPGSGASILYGCGEEWIDVPNPRPAESSRRNGKKKWRRRRDRGKARIALVSLPIQGALSGARRSGPIVARHARQARSADRRSRMLARATARGCGTTRPPCGSRI